MFNDNSYLGGAPEDPPPSSSHENPDQLLIKRFNQQSIRLLESLSIHSKKTTTPSQAATDSTNDSQEESGTNDKSTTDKVAPAGGDHDVQPASFRANRRDWTYDDLAGHENMGDFLDDQSKVGSRMHEVDRGRYTIVPQGQQASVTSSMVKEHLEAMKSWNPALKDCIAPQDATEALKNLSPAGYLMRSSGTNRLEDTVPEELQERLKSTYYASNELLRHFWLCFPAVEPSLEAKLNRLHETLKKFESSKLQTFHDGLPRDQRHLLNHLMRGQFKVAHRKYDSWKSKRRNVRPRVSSAVGGIG